jgi:hypothetical protein
VPDLADATDVIDDICRRVLAIAEQKFGVVAIRPGCNASGTHAHNHARADALAIQALQLWLRSISQDAQCAPPLSAMRKPWAHIDKNYKDDTSNLYPKKVTPGPNRPLPAGLFEFLWRSFSGLRLNAFSAMRNTAGTSLSNIRTN